MIVVAEGDLFCDTLPSPLLEFAIFGRGDSRKTLEFLDEVGLVGEFELVKERFIAYVASPSHRLGGVEEALDTQ